MKKITYSLFLLCLVFGLNAQTYFSDDFSDGDISDWTIYDADGDSYNWGPGDWSFNGNLPEFSASVASRSWISGVGGLTPDNYLVSPAIDLTNASAGIQLEYLYGTPQSAPFHDETYSVYVTTSNTLSALQAASPLHTETLALPSSSSSNVINLDAFIGQTVYVSFRHYNTFDENVLVIDDVVVNIPLSLDAELENVTLNRYSLVSNNNQLSFEVNNNGSTTITSLEVNWNDGTTDHIQTIPVSIAPGQTVTVDHPTFVNYSTVEEKDITVTILNVNGTPDGDANNNSLDTKFNTMSQAGTTRVVIEQQTGTWCGWCPRGKVGMAYMKNTYPNDIVLLAVHAGDPMELTEYTNGVNSIIGGSYPDAAINRKFNADPGTNSLEAAYNSEINAVVPVELSSTATLNGVSLTIDASATFFTKFSNANLRLSVIISEDNVTGTSSNYAQANFYSGGANGAMGGYESLPNPVPASQMVYNYVGRALLGGFNGQAGSVPTVINNGDVATHTFTYTIPPTVDQNNLFVTVLLLDGIDGSAVTGLQEPLSQVLSVENSNIIQGVSVYPNPAADVININMQQSSGDYNVSIYDMLGRQVVNSSFKNLNGSNELEIPLNSLSAGQYLLKLTSNDNTFATKFIKQ